MNPSETVTTSIPAMELAIDSDQSQPPLPTQIEEDPEESEEPINSPQELKETIIESPNNQTSQSQLHQPSTNSLNPIDSIANLRKLSDALSSFQRCFSELQHHIDTIRTSIDSMLPPQSTNTTPLPTSPSPTPARAAPEALPSSLTSARAAPEALPPSPARAAPEPVPVPVVPVNQASSSEPQLKENKLESQRSVLERLCRMNSSRDLRRYMVAQLAEISRLREEVPKALKLSSNPAKLVLDCFGRFFLQGIRAYIKGSPMIPTREAAILILECFLLMGIDEGVVIEKVVKDEADKSAMAWRSRLIAEGGLEKAGEMDKRGLLLLIGCFGIPVVFKHKDIRDLLQGSNAKVISSALRKSKVLMPKIPEIIEGMLKRKMQVDAVDIAYTFGLEDKFTPQTILSSFLQESKESLKKMQKESQGSLAVMNEANKKQLYALRSVIKCLEAHNIDPSKLLPEWQINEMFMRLESEIAELSKQIGDKRTQKRKVDETELSRRFRNNEAKRSHFSNHGSEQRSHYSNQGPEHQRLVNHLDNTRTLLDGGTAGHIYGYSLSPSGSIRANVVGSLAGTVGGGMHMGGVGAGIPATVDGARAGMLAGSDVMQAGPYAGTPAQVISHHGHLYGLRGDEAMHDRLVSQSYAYRPSPNLGGSMGLPSTIPSAVAGRNSASDLYQYADPLTQSELYRNGSQAVGAVPPNPYAHPSSYLYGSR